MADITALANKLAAKPLLMQLFHASILATKHADNLILVGI